MAEQVSGGWNSDAGAFFTGIQDLLKTGVTSWALVNQVKQGQVAVSPETGQLYTPGKPTTAPGSVQAAVSGVNPLLLLLVGGVIVYLVVR